MRFIRRYLIPRFIQYLLVTWLGITLVFFLPRLLPTDPVEMMVATIRAQGAFINPAAAEEMVYVLREMYGLEAGLLDQYLSFWRRLATLDFGPSLFTFPTPVSQLIARALPWTVGLLLTSTILAWIVGTLFGGLVGYFARSRMLQMLDGILMLVRPIPYYVFALILLVLFAHLVPIFPFGGGLPIGARMAFTWSFLSSLLMHAALPIISLVVLGIAANHQTMRLIVQTVKDEHYVRYAKLGNVKERLIFARYVMRNAMLPQVTGLALSLGTIFGGALITEIVFAYPGIGSLLFQAILHNDFNLIMGIMTISIVAISTCILIIDLLYPLIDPRIRFK